MLINFPSFTFGEATYTFHIFVNPLFSLIHHFH